MRSLGLYDSPNALIQPVRNQIYGGVDVRLTTQNDPDDQTNCKLALNVRFMNSRAVGIKPLAVLIAMTPVTGANHDKDAGSQLAGVGYQPPVARPITRSKTNPTLPLGNTLTIAAGVIDTPPPVVIQSTVVVPSTVVVDNAAPPSDVANLPDCNCEPAIVQTTLPTPPEGFQVVPNYLNQPSPAQQNA